MKNNDLHNNTPSTINNIQDNSTANFDSHNDSQNNPKSYASHSQDGSHKIEEKNSSESLVADFDISLIADLFVNMERQGPGSQETTIKALSYIEGISSTTKIADIGCGTGTQTLTLAEQTHANITALDLFPVFIDKLDRRKCDHNIKVVQGSMDNLPFEKGEFDIIWAEGSIFIMGYENGLKYWRDFLKPKGYIVVSDLTWFTDSRPKEINDYFNFNNPEITTIANKIEILENCGYTLINHFNLPTECWEDVFYKEMKRELPLFRQRHNNNPSALEFAQREEHEMKLYSKYKEYFGYTLFIAKNK